MSFTLLAECLGVGVKTTECSHDLLLFCAKLAPACAQRDRIGCLFWTEAPVATACIRRTNGAASRVGYWTKARCTLCDHYTDRSPQFALYADTVWRSVRFAPVQVGANYFHKLVFIDWATTQLEVNIYVIGNRR